MSREPTFRDYAVARDASTLLYGLATVPLIASLAILLVSGEKDWLSHSPGPLTLVASLFLFVQAAKQQQRAKRLRPAGHTESTSILRLGVLAGVVMMLVIMFTYPVHPGGGRNQARKTACLSSVKQLGVAALLYAADDNDLLPLASSWMDGIRPYFKEEWLLVCTAESMDAGDRSETMPKAYGRAMNRYLSGAGVSKAANPEEQHLFYDSDAVGRNQSELMPKFPAWRHYDGSYLIVFVDGHAKARGGQSPERR